MIKIIVKDNCNGCGLCIMNCNYLEENAEGNAQAVSGKIIKNSDIDNLKKVISECPNKSLELIDKQFTNKKGYDGLSDLLEVLKRKCDNFNVNKVTNLDVKLNVNNYDINTPFSPKEYSYYTSESSAKSTARDEFDRLCYSQSAYRPILKKLFVEYKINVLKPFYSFPDDSESIYFKYVEEIKDLLSDIYSEIQEQLELGKNIPEDWKNFNVNFTDNDFFIERLKGFENRSTSSGIIDDFKSRGKYTSLGWYIDRLDIDYHENYAGEGLFGRTKYKKEWYFRGFEKIAKEYIDDLKNAINSMSRDIEDDAIDTINYGLGTFEQRIKDELKIKISELENYYKKR
ncbi:protein of unknown function [Acetoanaerobium sticklandii]|uniref:4Fe-4S ferredoxin-type domain-containing protein n=1 Tax=Acetoanaerobium sticklandii (strain ATCC 12662 / DSM 519 / JCM 1433 / CCUG 9281 / NCIMB 10654 / HF) TaxID=499177 RepID=E3PY80_ACESD|nr:ferredoxin [Acetoanaerobium sticklandii]CBH21395.1 protein of unknown function [Acetoanaerobium sticklandii]